MDNFKEEAAISSREGKAKTTWEKREEFEDGSYSEIKVEQVSNGFIKTENKHFKKGENWKYECIKSIHDENPMEEKSLVSKLQEALKNY